jgi:phage gp29-like protein
VLKTNFPVPPLLSRLFRPRTPAPTAYSLAPTASPATALDFQSGTFFGLRRLSPELVRATLERASVGDLAGQWDLFSLMEDTWPRLAKNLAELRRAAARADYTVTPAAARGARPTPAALERAALVELALRRWAPRPGTLELSFADTLFHALDAYGKGVSVLEIQWAAGPAGLLPRCAHVLSPRRYGWNPAGSELGLLACGAEFGDRSSDLGVRTSDPRSPCSSVRSPISDFRSPSWSPFPPDRFLIGLWQARTGAPGATAVLRALAPYWAGVTFGWEWLLSNAQIFGVPFRWASYDRNHPALGAQLRDLLAAMGSSGYAAFPEGTKLEFHAAAQNVAGNPQVVIQELADRACDLLLLGQELSGAAHGTGLGGTGASKLQAVVRADRLQAVAHWCADLLNYQLVPAVLRANFGDTAEPPVIAPDLDEDPDPLADAQRDQILLAAGLPLPRAWLYARHGIPAPVEDEPVVGGGPPPAGVTSDG